jgi:hypothetical protein
LPEATIAPAPAQLSAVAWPNAMIPGAPPLMLVSVTVIRVTPSCRNEIVEPVALNCSVVPAGNGPES